VNLNEVVSLKENLSSVFKNAVILISLQFGPTVLFIVLQHLAVNAGRWNPQVLELAVPASHNQGAFCCQICCLPQILYHEYRPTFVVIFVFVFVAFAILVVVFDTLLFFLK
jgi:hypothetical protein